MSPPVALPPAPSPTPIPADVVEVLDVLRRAVTPPGGAVPTLEEMAQMLGLSSDALLEEIRLHLEEDRR
jgi:hypothetical protein